MIITLGILLLFIVLVVDTWLDRTCSWCGEARPTLKHFRERHLHDDEVPR